MSLLPVFSALRVFAVWSNLSARYPASLVTLALQLVPVVTNAVGNEFLLDLDVLNSEQYGNTKKHYFYIGQPISSFSTEIIAPERTL